MVEKMLTDLENYVSNCHGIELDRKRPDWHHGMNHEGEQLLDVWRALLKSVPEAEQINRERTWLRQFFDDCKKWAAEDTQSMMQCEDQVLLLSENVYVNEGLTCPKCKQWSREFAAYGRCEGKCTS